MNEEETGFNETAPGHVTVSTSNANDMLLGLVGMAGVPSTWESGAHFTLIGPPYPRVTETDTFSVLLTQIVQDLQQFEFLVLQTLGFQVTANPVSQQVNEAIVTATTSAAKSLSVKLTSPANGAKVTKGSTVTLKVTVTSSSKAVSGAKVTITVNGATVCSATSNKSGSASCKFKVSTSTGVTYSWFATATETGYRPGTSPTFTFYT